jgi:malate synthase
VFRFSEEYLDIPPRSIKVTVLIETILAAFEMEEILYALKEYIVGLNAGRWDYIFSVIKKFSSRKDFLFPDRGSISMRVPFLTAYAELLVKTCLKRGAQPIGGMSAFVPSRKDADLNAKAFAKVREDKEREAAQGFVGTWVAHPDLVPVAREPMLAHTRKDESTRTITEKDLLNFAISGGKITDEGISQNVEVAIDYIDAWLQGSGAVALHHLMEDAATAEISRAQLWQWVHHGAVPEEKVLKLIDASDKTRAKELLRKLVVSKPFIDFFTLEAYKEL